MTFLGLVKGIAEGILQYVGICIGLTFATEFIGWAMSEAEYLVKKKQKR